MIKMLSKKYYKQFAELIADRINDNIRYHPEDSNCNLDCHLQEIDSIKDYLVWLFKEDNPSFNESLFLAEIEKLSNN